jgi:hypothetical protein
MPYCQTFQQRIKEIKRKAQNIEALLSEYVKTGDKKTEKEIEGILKEIEELRQEFKTKATQLIEEFIQRRENKQENLEIIFDEKDGRFIIDGNLDFHSRTHLNDFPNLIKEITGYFDVYKAQTINLPNLKEVGGYFYADKAQTINLPNLKEVGRFFFAPNAQTLNLPNLKEVGGYFNAYNARTINLQNLKKIGRSFNAYNARTINLPNLEKIGEFFNAPNAQTINLPNLKEVGRFFFAPNAQTINLPNIKEIRGDIYFNDDNSNLNSLVELAREWRKKGILKGKIKLYDKRGNIVQEF